MVARDRPGQDRPGHVAPRALPGATVLQVVPSLADDQVARATLDTAFALLRSGARAIVAAGDGALAGELQGVGGEWHALDTETTNPLTLRRNAEAVGALVASERVDLIHARGVGAARSAASAVERTGAWFVTSIADATPPAHKPLKAYTRALAHADRVIAQSRFVADGAVARHGLARDRIAVIARRIDTATFDPAVVGPERVAALRSRWGVRPGERVLLVPGRIDPAKGQELVVEAARLLVNGGARGIVFVLVGDSHGHGDYARAVAQHAEAQGVGEVVRMIGPCADMAGAYATSDFVVVPAVVPPTFSRVVAEAAAMGRPVIASAIGALPEFVLAPPRLPEAARTGWLVAPDDAVALARAAATAVAVDAPVYRAMSERSRHLAELLFSPGRIAAATLGVYASLLEESA